MGRDIEPETDAAEREVAAASFAAALPAPEDIQEQILEEIDTLKSSVNEEAYNVYQRASLSMVRQYLIQQKEEQELRRRAAPFIFILFVCELVFVKVFAVLVGLGVLHVDKWFAQTVVSGVLAQVAALGITVVRYLFRQDSSMVNMLLALLWGDKDVRTHLVDIKKQRE